MKKLVLFLFTVLLITSCSMDDGDPRKFNLEFVAIEHADIPTASFTPGHNYEITVYYRMPSDCHYYNGLYFEPSEDKSTWTVAVQTLVLEANDCKAPETDELHKATFVFDCRPGYSNEEYVFNFYQGEDEQGNALYLTEEVPVQ